VTFSLSKAQRAVCALLVRDRNPHTFAERVERVTDQSVLREVNYQLSRTPNSIRSQAVRERLEKLTGKKPATGEGFVRRWIGRGKGAVS
jgi:hypothetical protein